MAKNSLREKESNSEEEREGGLNKASANALKDAKRAFLKSKSMAKPKIIASEKAKTSKTPKIDTTYRLRKTRKNTTKSPSAIKLIVKEFFNGSLILEKGMKAYWGQFLLGFVLALLLIANQAITDNMLREITQLKGEMKGFKYEQLSTEGDRMNLSKQSSVAKTLEAKGIEESVVPPTKIVIN